MSAMLGLLRIEFRRNVGLWLFPLLVGLAWFAGYERYPDEVVLWTETSRKIGAAFVLLGPAIAGVAAWMATRERRRGMGELLATTPRPAFARDLTSWGATALWGLLAYLTVAAYLLVVAVRAATWGGPATAPIVIGFLAVAAHAALGYAAGAYVPSRFTAPLVAVALFVANVGMADVLKSPPSVEYLSTFRIVEAASGYIFYAPRTDLAAPHALWLVGLGGVALAVVAIRRTRRATAWGGLVVGILAMAAGVTLLLRTDARPRSLEPIPYEPVCTEAAIPVCLHPAYEAVLDETAAVVDGVVRPLVGLPGVPTRAEHRQDAPGPRPDGTLVIAPYHPLNGAAYEARNLVLNLVQDPSSVDWSAYQGLTEAQGVIAIWLLREAGIADDRADSRMSLYGLPIGIGAVGSLEERQAMEAAIRAAVDRFAALSPEERRAWLEANFASLRAGQLTLEDLP